ncbi:hypothetical protein EC991_001394 [Linnemannia zychae]|nr:hypothetical protein EC991_001394 [Linnemannia zychae]
MSATTTLLAWLIPCLILAAAFIAWRVHVYKTQGPFLPEALRRNVFARTRSMIPRTLSFNSSDKGAPSGTLPTTMPSGTNSSTKPVAAGGAIRNETRIDIPSDEHSSQPPMSSISSTAASPNPYAALPCDGKTSISSTLGAEQPAPVSPAIARLIAMR